ncbi:MAG: winged helix-turn-helix domain-containing protein [Burkholderiaceae bacterium]|nr:winged helix-turn-helix domain-containing protein [Burkholderiaceae bacterium]
METPPDVALQFDEGRVVVDPARRCVLVCGAPVPVRGRAFELLMALLERRERLVTKAELFALVWPGRVVEDNTLQVHVAALRHALGPHAVATVSGRGYRWALPLDPVPPAPGLADTAPARVPVSAAAEPSLLGREVEQRALAQWLADESVRVVTLTGTGGAGKTSLARQAHAAAGPAFADGAWFVALDALTRADELMDAVAAALGLPGADGTPAVVRVSDFAAARRMLLTLDNLEQLLPAAARPLQALIDAAPRLTLLLTSRRPTRLPAERELPVPPLALPGDGAAGTLRNAPAVQLFARGAAAHGRPLADDAAWHAAAAVCRRLDGLPLAIELAVARLRVMSPALLVERLAQGLQPLRLDAAAASPRQRTLQAVVDWSYALLDAGEQRLFRRLSVFAGGFTFEAAEAVDDEPATVLDRLEALLEHHLVQRVDDVDGAPRYTMLQTLREQARQRLVAADEEPMARERHARHLLALAQGMAPRLASPARSGALARLHAESHNLRQALRWWLQDRPDAEAALALAAALSWYWYFDGDYAEGRAQLDKALAAARPLCTTATITATANATARAALMRDRAAALSGAARLAAYAGDGGTALGIAADAIAAWQGLDDVRGLAFAHFHAGVAAIVAHRSEQARAALAEAQRLFDAAGDEWGLSLAVTYGGAACAVVPGLEDAARPLLIEGRARFRALGDSWGLAVASRYLGMIARREGDLDAARALTSEMLADARAVGDRFRIARNLHQLGEIDLAQGRWREAVPQLVESLRINAAQGRLGDAARQLWLLAQAAMDAGAAPTSARLAALAARHAGGRSTMPPENGPAPQVCEQALRQQLGPQRWQEAAIEGRLMSVEEAAALALGLLDEPHPEAGSGRMAASVPATGAATGAAAG